METVEESSSSDEENDEDEENDLIGHKGKAPNELMIYYSKFDKGQNFNFVCRRSYVSDTKNFVIDM